MIIETQRLLLRTITNEDIEYIHELHSHPGICEFNTTTIPESLDESIRTIKPFVAAQSNKPRKYYTFSLRLKSTVEFIGIAGITLSLDRYNSGEVYYEIAPEYWNKGYATEVVNKLIITGFQQLKLHRIEANTDSENHASIRVLEKSGMQKEGIKRKFLPIQGKWKDGCLFSIIEDDVL